MSARNSHVNGMIEKLARAKTLVTAVSIFLVTAVLVNTLFKPDFSFLTQTFHYDSEYAYQLLGHIGWEGRATHFWVLPADLLMVFCYTIALIGLNYRIFGKLSLNCATFSAVTLSPLLLAFVQLTEIVSLFILLISYPVQMDSLANWCNIVTIVKTVLTPICFLTPAIGWSLFLLRRRRMNIEQHRTN